VEEKTLQHVPLGTNSKNELEEIRDEAESILRELGLSSLAARSFLAILESSPLSATTLCQKTRIADSKIYYALKELEEKELVIRAGGTPQLYSAVKPSEVCETLGKVIEADYRRKNMKLGRLDEILKPLARTNRQTDNLEIAYIAKGLDNVIRRANKLLEEAEKEVVGYVWDTEIYSSLSESLRGLLEREVKTKFALNPNFLNLQRKAVKSSSLPIVYPANGKVLLCECNLIVVDGKKMISVTRTRADTYYAIITEDPGMIALGLSYYDNPTCCGFGK
jgi:sugar-specific transcriptional regulator TrmB